MSTNKIVKLAKKFTVKLALASVYEDILHIASMAKDLADKSDLLEKAVVDSEDIYEQESDKQKRVFKVRRLLSTIKSVGNQLIMDSNKFGISQKTASDYKNYLKMLLAWLRQVPGISKYVALTKPLENAIDAFAPTSIPATFTPELETELPGAAYKANKQDYKIKDTPTFEELHPKEPSLYYGPGMEMYE